MQHCAVIHWSLRRCITGLRALLILFIWSAAVLACTRTYRGVPATPVSTSLPAAVPQSTPTPLPIPTATATPTAAPAAQIEKGGHALRNGDWDQALAMYGEVLKSASDPQIQSAALLGAGKAYLAAGKYPEAIQTLGTLISQYPQAREVAWAHFYQAQAYSASKDDLSAAQKYLDYLTIRPGVIDSYVLGLRADALFAAGDYAGAANDYRAALQAPSLADGTLLEMKVARSVALSGDLPGAIALYDDLYTRTENENTRALIDLRKGQAYTNLGQVQDAYAAYLDAVNNYPTAYESYSALQALVEAGVTVDELNRGIVDYYAGQYGLAAAALDRYLQKSPPDPGTALYYYGLILQAQGGYAGAIAQWDKLIQNYPDHRYWDDAWEQKGYTQWAYLDQYAEGVKTLLDFVERVPRHPRAGEFVFDAAAAAERGGDLDQAAKLWERVGVEYPNDTRAQRALFLAGISRYRRQDYQGAFLSFQRALSVADNLNDRAAAMLWSAKSLREMGQEGEMRATLEQASTVDPTGYYSVRARDLLNGREPFKLPLAYDLAVDSAAEQLKADEWVRTTFNLPADKDLSGLGNLAQDPYLARGAELWELGLYSEARGEFEQLRSSLQQDAENSYRLTNYLDELGLHRQATLAARQVLALAGMNDATSLGAPAYFNHLRFGTHYNDLILPLAQKYGFHPLFLFSVVRQESLFESFVRSSAEASGLMQIMPATGADIAARLDWPPGYQEVDLYRPMVNLTFGVDYLDAQRRAFDGDLYAVLAAYNGGPGNAQQWLKNANGDADLFLELIRYEETRSYIRGIYEVYTIYRQLYDRSP